VRKIETWSTVNPLSLCVEIPRNACEHCHGKGIQVFEEGQVKGNYRYVQLINRKDKDYRQQGF